MKRVFTSLFFSAFFFSSFSQKAAEELSGILNRIGQNIPADQVFLHTDRNLYYPNDTIRFQAYIRDRQTGIFETGSISLYVLLVDALNRTIDSARFRIANSTSPGWLSAPDSSVSGDYNLVAFTGSMINYDPEYAFRTSIRVEENVQVKRKRLQTSSQNESSILKPEATFDSLSISFLPEGGTFVYGVKQRLAFNAVTSSGSSYKAEGKIINQKGEFICDFKSEKEGPGFVEFTPLCGNSYFAVINGVEFTGLKWQLPTPDSSGISLRTFNSIPGILSIQINNVNKVTNVNTIPNRQSPFTLSLIMNNSLVYANEIYIDSLIRFKINTEELPMGTASVIVFDDRLKPLAERLVFLNYHKKIKTDTETTDSFCKKGEDAELSVITTDQAGNNVASVISLSVIDSASGYYDKFPVKEIAYELLYDKDFYNNLPDKVKISSLTNLDINSLDLLLMTYGWRKFKPHDPDDTTKIREIKSYDYLTIREEGPLRKKQREINLISIEGVSALILKPAASRETLLLFDSLNSDVRQVIIMPDKKATVNNNPLSIIFPQNKTYLDKVKQFKTQDFTTPPENSFYRNSTKDAGSDSTIKIGEVLIRGAQQPPEKVLNKYQVQYRYTNPITLNSNDFKTDTYFEDILVRLHPFFLDPKAKKVYITMGRTGRYSAPALIVVDDNPMFGSIARNGRWESDYSTIADMPASNISSVTMIRGVQGFPLYGEQALGGIIFVTTNQKAMRDGTYEEVQQYRPELKNNLAKPIRIFRSEIEYYIPTKEQVKLIPEYHNRPTLFWANELITDGTGHVKIRYPNNLFKGTIFVIINGVTFDNIPFSSTIKYSIK